MECYYCKAKAYCIAATQPGSVVCMVNRMRYGGTHADDAPPRQAGELLPILRAAAAGDRSGALLQ